MADLQGATMLCLHLETRRTDGVAMAVRAQAHPRHTAGASRGAKAVSVAQKRRGVEGVVTPGSHVEGHSSWIGASLGQHVQVLCAQVSQRVQGLLRQVFEEDRELAH